MITRQVTAVILIDSCLRCPFLVKKRHYTSDNFEHAHDWFCKKGHGKKIAGYIDWNEEDDIEIPTWCPIKTDL